MPGSILSADTGFPTFTGSESSEEKIRIITNYLYMLLEQLKYANAHVGVENFSESGLDDLEELITEPIYARLADDDGRLTSLSLTAAGLSSRMTDAEGNITTLTATANGLNTRITDAEGNITTLTATAAGLTSAVYDADGEVSSKISQSMAGLSLSVTNGAGYSKMQLLSNGAVLATSGQITLGGNVVFASDLTDGVTQISGSNILTGTINAIDITGSTISGSVLQTTLSSAGANSGAVEMYYINTGAANWLAGGLRLDDSGAGTATEARYRMYLYTNKIGSVPFGLKLEGAGNVSLESKEGSLYIAADKYIRMMLNEDSTQQTGITIGAGGQNVYLVGNVYINGKLQA